MGFLCVCIVILSKKEKKKKMGATIVLSKWWTEITWVCVCRGGGGGQVQTCLLTLLFNFFFSHPPTNGTFWSAGFLQEQTRAKFPYFNFLQSSQSSPGYILGAVRLESHICSGTTCCPLETGQSPSRGSVGATWASNYAAPGTISCLRPTPPQQYCILWCLAAPASQRSLLWKTSYTEEKAEQLPNTLCGTTRVE